MAARRRARVLLPLAWANSSLLSYHSTLYGASINAFGLGYLIFAIVWLRIVWHEYCCLWLGLIHFCYHVAVRCMARVSLPLAWVTSTLRSYGRTPYGASIIALGMCQLIFVIIWLYLVWRKYDFLWPGLPHFCHRMAVHHMARVLLHMACVDSSLLSYGRTPYGASIIAFGLGYLIFAIHGCTSYGASIIAFGLG